MSTAKRRFVANVSTNVLYLALTALFGLWYTPYLLQHLGVAAYGFVPLAASITSYMSILTTGLNSAIGRFLTIDLVKGDRKAANRTFNTALFGAASLLVILLCVLAVTATIAPSVLNVPQGLETDVRWLLLFVGVAFLVVVLGSCFAVPSFSYNRFDLQNWVKSVRLFALAGLTVGVFAILRPQLWQIGATTLAAALVSLGGDLILWRKLAPELTVRLRDRDRSQFRDLMSMSSWVVVNQVGTLLFVNIDLIVVNMIFGAEMGGRYGSVLQLPILMRSLATAISVVLAPIVIARYAKNDMAGIVRVSCKAVKFMGLGMALPIGLLCGLARPILTVWLGSSFQDLDLLLIILSAHLIVNLAVLPLFQVQVSTNRVRWPGIASLVMGVLNLGLAVAWAKWGSWGAVSVAAAGAVVLTAKNAVFTPLYNAYILRLRWWTFLPSMLAGVIGTAAVALAAYGLAHLLVPHNWLGLMGVSAVVTMGYGLGAYVLAIDHSDRQLLKSLGTFGLKV